MSDQVCLSLEEAKEFNLIVKYNEIDASTAKLVREIVFVQKIITLKKLKCISLTYKRTRPDMTYHPNNIVSNPYVFCSFTNALIGFEKCERVDLIT